MKLCRLAAAIFVLAQRRVLIVARWSLAHGFEVHVDLKLDRVARGVRGLDVQLGRWLEQRMVSSAFPSRPCGCSSMETAAAI